jgi:hypothetical protein
MSRSKTTLSRYENLPKVNQNSRHDTILSNNIQVNGQIGAS